MAASAWQYANNSRTRKGQDDSKTRYHRAGNTGVSFNDNVISNKENNYLAAVYFGTKKVGVSFLDITTGEFYAAEGTKEYVEKLLANFSPSRRCCTNADAKSNSQRRSVRGIASTTLEQWIFSLQKRY